MKTPNEKKKDGFETFSSRIARAAGSTTAFACACGLVLLWGLSGPFFGYSQEWQLVISTGTTIITFLMVFVIQKAQNKDSLAIQLKLNELVASHKFSSNSLINIEGMTEEEMRAVEKYYQQLSEQHKTGSDKGIADSIANIKKDHGN
jgi:low affinity Fe/Cu permease